MHARAPWGGAVRFDTGCDKFLGWIVAEVLTPNDRVPQVLADVPDHPAFVAQERIRNTPYRVLILELDRKVHEDGGYETNDDYRRKEVHRFETQEQAEDFLRGIGVAMEDLVDPRDVDAP